jgi:hypothetical protein
VPSFGFLAITLHATCSCNMKPTVSQWIPKKSMCALRRTAVCLEADYPTKFLFCYRAGWRPSPSSFGLIPVTVFFASFIIQKTALLHDGRPTSWAWLSTSVLCSSQHLLYPLLTQLQRRPHPTRPAASRLLQQATMPFRQLMAFPRKLSSHRFLALLASRSLHIYLT